MNMAYDHKEKMLCLVKERERERDLPNERTSTIEIEDF